MFVLSEGFTFGNFLVDLFAIFVFVVWLWLAITVIADLLRRNDLSGWVKAIWIVGLILLPYVAVLLYFITQSDGMTARNLLYRPIGSIADQLEKLHRLKEQKLISEVEFTRLRSQLSPLLE